MKYIELKNLARKAFPCKIFQGKNFLARFFKENISLQDVSRKTFPCKIFQGKHFLARSCKEQISLQDPTSNCIFTRILQDPCKERIFSRPGLFCDEAPYAYIRRLYGLQGLQKFLTNYLYSFFRKLIEQDFALVYIEKQS